MSFVGAVFKKPKLQTSPLALSLDPDTPRKLVIGRTSTAGAFVFKSLSDRERNDNRNLNQIFVLAGHQLTSLKGLWAGGERIRLRNGLTTFPHGVRREVETFRDDGRTRMWVTFYDGRPNQTADPFMVQTVQRPVRWRTTDRLRGCAYVVVTMQHDADTLNTPKDILAEVEGAKFYDRRRDSTAGGAGNQRWNNPATWTYTTNPAVVADHYQLGILGGEFNDKLIFGMGLNTWQVSYEEFAANADLCDEIVFGIPRYAVNGELSAGDDHRDNISKLAEAMAAKPYDAGGRIFIRPQQARPITLTLTDDDLVANTTFDLEESPSGSEIINTVNGTFRDPNGKFNNQSYPSVADEDLISQDSRAFETTLDLSLETNSDRAQRIATIELEVQKRRDILNETFMPIANVVTIGDWVERISKLRGDVTKVYEVIQKRTNTDLTVDLELRETDPSITAFGPNQARPVVTPDPLPPFEILIPDPPEVELVTVERESGGATLPAVDITVIPPEDEDFDGVDAFEVEYGPSNGLAGDDLAIVDGQASYITFANIGQRILPIDALLPARIYLYRIRTIHNNRAGPFGPYQTFTSTDKMVSTDANALGGRLAPIALADIDANRVSVLDLIATFGSTQSAAQSATAALQTLGVVQAAQDNILDVQTIIETAHDAVILLELSATAEAEAASHASGAASISEAAAAQSVMDADVIRSAVADLEMLAANSRNDAEAHADASLAHAQSAESHADTAGVHSSAALVERLLATTAAQNANLSLQQTRPATFENGGSHFSISVHNGSPASTVDAASDNFIVADQDADGFYLERTNPSIIRSIIQKGGEDYIVGHTYRVTCAIKAQSGSGTVHIRGRRTTGDYDNQGVHHSGAIVVAGELEVHTFDFVANATYFDAGTRKVLAEVVVLTTGSLIPRVYFLDIDDVTMEVTASGHASAAAIHSASAEAHSDSAGDSAEASLGHSIDASTDAGQAQISALAAVGSAADAEGHSNSAERTLELIAQAALVSHMNNPQFLRWNDGDDLPVGVNHFGPNNQHARETALARTGNAILLDTATNTNHGIFQSTRIAYNGDFGINPDDIKTRHVVLSAWVMLLDGTFQGTGLFLSGRSASGPIAGGNAIFNFHTEVPNPELGVWYHFEKYFELPATNYEALVEHVDLFGMSSWVGFGANSLNAKRILFDAVVYRAASAEEIEGREAIAQLGASVTQTSQALTNIEGDLASRFGVQVKAGTNGAELELIALDGSNQGSAARLAGNEIILDGTLEAAHFADGSLYNLAVDSSFAIHNLGQNEIEVASRVFTSVGRIVRFDISGLGVMGLDGIQGNQALGIGIQGFEIWLSLYRDNQLVVSGERFTDLMSFTADGGGTHQPSPSRRGSLVLTTTPPAGVHLYSLRAQRIWTAVGTPAITPKLQDVQMLITEVDN